MELEKDITLLIQDIEKGLLQNKLNTTIPHIVLEYLNKLGAYTSTAMGLIEKLNTMEAEHFVNTRESEKTDLGTKKKWKLSKEGIRQGFWENRIKRMKILIDTLERTYYAGRNELKETKEYKQ